MPSRPKKPATIDVEATIERLKDPANMKTADGKRIKRKLCKSIAVETAKGVVQREKVYQMHVEKRMTHKEIAEALGVTISRVGVIWRDICASLAERVPQTPETYLQMRAEVNGQLDAAYQDACVVRSNPQLLAVRLKILEMKAKLFGLNLEANNAPTGDKPYTPPEEIAQEVEKMQLAMYARRGDVMEAREALQQQEERDVTPP